MPTSVETFHLRALSIEGRDVKLKSGAIHVRTNMIATGSLGSARDELTEGTKSWDGSGTASDLPADLFVAAEKGISAESSEGKTLTGNAFVEAASGNFTLQGTGSLTIT